MTPLMIALAIIMPLLACALNSWLNIKIKFAPDAIQAKRDVGKVLLKILDWVMTLYFIGLIVWNCVPPSPVTSLNLLILLVPIAGLAHQYLMWWVGKFIWVLKPMADDLDRLNMEARNPQNRLTN